MEKTALNYPAVFFWYGVLSGIHEHQREELRSFALDTILSASKYSNDSLDYLDWFEKRENFAYSPEEYRRRAWELARFWVLHGPGLNWVELHGEQLSSLNVTPNGLAILPPAYNGDGLLRAPGAKQRMRATPKPVRTLGSRNDDMPPDQHSEAPF